MNILNYGFLGLAPEPEVLAGFFVVFAGFAPAPLGVADGGIPPEDPMTGLVVTVPGFAPTPLGVADGGIFVPAGLAPAPLGVADGGIFVPAGLAPAPLGVADGGMLVPVGRIVLFGVIVVPVGFTVPGFAGAGVAGFLPTSGIFGASLGT